MYDVIQHMGQIDTYSLRSKVMIAQHTAIGIVAGRLMELDRWLKEVKDDEEKLVGSCYNISAESIADVASKHGHRYTGPDLVLEHYSVGNEFKHLHDTFWEDGSARANCKIYVTPVWNSAKGFAVLYPILYATRRIKPGETLYIDWGDEFWAYVSRIEVKKMAATAWSSLHIPLLKLRQLARENGLNPAVIAPYYAGELAAAAAATAADMNNGAGPSTPMILQSPAGATIVNEKRKRSRDTMFIDDQGCWRIKSGDEAVEVVAPPPSIPLELESSLPRDERFRVLSEQELSTMSCYSPTSDYSNLGAENLNLLKGLSSGTALPRDITTLLTQNSSSKIAVAEIMDIHHPVRFLTRPDRPAYGVVVKESQKLKTGDALGVYTGKFFKEKIWSKQANPDTNFYTYTIPEKDIAEICADPVFARKRLSILGNLAVDATEFGNETRFINDIYGREDINEPNVNCSVVIDPETGHPHYVVTWTREKPSEALEEVVSDYGGIYWKIAGRALQKDLYKHAEVALTAMAKLRKALREKGVKRKVIGAALTPVDIKRWNGYLREHSGSTALAGSHCSALKYESFRDSLNFWLSRRQGR